MSSRPTVAALKPAITAARALLQAVAFEQADHRQHDPGDDDDPAVVERLAELRDHLDEIEPGEQPGRQRRDRSRPASD